MKLIVVSVLWGSALAQYVPEPYGWACYRMAAKRPWPSCTSVHRTKQKQCLCSVPEFVALTELCLDEAVANVTDPQAAREAAHSQSLCRVSNDLSNPDELTGSLKKPSNATVPEMEHVNPINSEEINMAILTAAWRMTNDRRATRSGVILIVYWGAILLARYAVSLAAHLLPQKWVAYFMTIKNIRILRAHLLNSPLGRRRHCEPALGVLGIRPPTRVIAIVIAVFAAINYVLIFSDFPYEPLNFIYTSPRQQYNKSLAIRAAFMIMWKLPLLVCFAGRNNIFQLFGHPWPLDTFIVLHKWIARITVVDIIIHSVAISLVKSEQGIYGAVWLVDYWRWGIAGTIITSIIALQSGNWMRRKCYDTFAMLHVVLGVVFLIAAWFHVYTLPYGKYHIIATCAVWGFDRVLRIARAAITGSFSASLRHCGSSSILTIKPIPRLYRCLGRQSRNTYAFIHILNWRWFWQSHPFTIVRQGAVELRDLSDSMSTAVIKSHDIHNNSADKSGFSEDFEYQKIMNDDAELVVCIKHRRGMTNAISRIPEGSLILALDGPYGYSYPIHKFSRALLFAGGVGITPVLNYVNRCLELRGNSEMEIQVHWAASEVSSLMWALEELSRAPRNVTVFLYMSGSARGEIAAATDLSTRVSVVEQRLKCMEIIKTEISISNSKFEQGTGTFAGAIPATLPNGSKNTIANKSRLESDLSCAIFACGPDTLNDDARLAACWAIKHSEVFIEYYEESFSW